jgi:hypothetical protein
MSQQNHNKKNKANSKSVSAKTAENHESGSEPSIEVEVIEVTAADDLSEPEISSDESIESSSSSPDEETELKEKESVKIDFPYSEILREKAPKAFEVAEKVATDWKNEGDFTDLGITHPVAGIVASQALMKAKEVEKKLEEKGVFTIAKMGFEIAKSQVENLRSKIGK